MPPFGRADAGEPGGEGDVFRRREPGEQRVVLEDDGAFGAGAGDLPAIDQHAAGIGRQETGGQRQRVGLARALAADPAFLLMDEPLGALDAMTREGMQDLLLSAWDASGAGTLLITHGVEEALYLATRIIVMAPGPGRIIRRLDVDFGRRRLAGESARSIKASPAFVAAREDLLDSIFEREAA